MRPELNVGEPELCLPCALLADLSAVGEAMAEALSRCNPGVILLQGSLGAGKTTLARLLVSRLPGGAEAEIASPSFTIANIYYTSPEVHHFDLYRLEPGMPDASLEDSFDNTDTLTLVEWPERIPAADMPEDGVLCGLNGPGPDGRIVFRSLGPKGRAFLKALGEVRSRNLNP